MRTHMTCGCVINKGWPFLIQVCPHGNKVDGSVGSVLSPIIPVEIIQERVEMKEQTGWFEEAPF